MIYMGGIYCLFFFFFFLGGGTSVIFLRGRVGMTGPPLCGKLFVNAVTRKTFQMSTFASCVRERERLTDSQSTKTSLLL